MYKLQAACMVDYFRIMCLCVSNVTVGYFMIHYLHVHKINVNFEGSRTRDAGQSIPISSTRNCVKSPKWNKNYYVSH